MTPPILKELTPENWPTKRLEVFDALTQLEDVALEAALKEIAKVTSVSLTAVKASWREYLGPAPKEDKSQAGDAVALALGAWQLWQDTEKTAWATCQGVSFPIESREAKHLLKALFFEKRGAVLGGQGQTDALGTLEAKALALKEPPQQVYTRFAALADRVIIDLGDESGRVIEIAPGAWQILPTAPVKFRRSRTAQPLPLPKSEAGALEKLRLLLGLEGDNWKLFVGWLLGCFTGGPYPLLAINGPQGAGKSLLARAAKAVLDPHKAPLVALPSSETDLVISAQGAYVLAFDNLSSLSPALSDAFCRLATGGGIRARQLYTNAGEVALEAKRPVILNGISNFLGRPDLIDRALWLTLPSRKSRLTEKALEGELEQLAPGVLGALCDIAAYALAHPVRPSDVGRLADWGAWVAACEAHPHLALTPGTIREAEKAARLELIAEAAENDPLAAALLALPEFDFLGTPLALEAWLRDAKKAAIEEERDEAHQLGLALEAPGFPRTARGIGASLKRLAPALAVLGVHIEQQGRTTAGRMWSIRRDPHKG